MSYGARSGHGYGNNRHKSKFTVYQAHVKSSGGSIVVPFTDKRQASTYIKDFKKTNPSEKVEAKIEKIDVPEERLSPLEKQAFEQKPKAGSMMVEAKNLRDRGDIVGARMLEHLARCGTKTVRLADDDFVIERNGYRLKFDKGASIKSSVKFWSKAQADNYVKGDMVKELEKGNVSWKKIA